MTAPHTMDEAASELGMSRRKLQDWLAEHPVDSAGLPYYVPNGNRKLFSADDIGRINLARREREARRIQEVTPCRGNSSRRVRAKRRIGTSGENTSALL